MYNTSNECINIILLRSKNEDYTLRHLFPTVHRKSLMPLTREDHICKYRYEEEHHWFVNV